MISNGSPCTPHGINSEGLKRRGYSSEAIMAIKRAYKAIYRQNLSLEDAKASIAAAVGATPELQLPRFFCGVHARHHPLNPGVACESPWWLERPRGICWLRT